MFTEALFTIVERWKQPKNGVVGNFMCLFDWVMGCPYICLNIILGVSVKVFLDEINI